MRVALYKSCTYLLTYLVVIMKMPNGHMSMKVKVKLIPEE